MLPSELGYMCILGTLYAITFDEKQGKKNKFAYVSYIHLKYAWVVKMQILNAFVYHHGNLSIETLTL
jgi:hypothetical protein